MFKQFGFRSFVYDAYMFNLSIQFLYAISSIRICNAQTSLTAMTRNKSHGYWMQSSNVHSLPSKHTFLSVIAINVIKLGFQYKQDGRTLNLAGGFNVNQFQYAISNFKTLWFRFYSSIRISLTYCSNFKTGSINQS